ncbi:MAG: histidine phosphatase family protein, partial [Dehalococcoidia bacterium]
MRLLLIRHAESVGNAESRLQGQEDYPLSERGLAQAALLARRLQAEPPHALYASPLLRAHRTAEIVADAINQPVRPLPAVIEYHFGEVSGLTWAEIRQRYPDLVARQRQRTAEYPAWPGEEGREVFRDRVCAALWELEERHKDETVAVVAHAGPVLVFCLSVLDMPYKRPMPFACDNASVTSVLVRDGRGTILSV